MMTWEEDGESAIRVLATEDTPSSFGEDFDGYVLNRLANCGGFELFEIRGGVVQDESSLQVTPLHHARLCMTDLGDDTECNGADCNRCAKEWCEGTELSTCDDER